MRRPIAIRHFLAPALLLSATALCLADNFTLTILHTNDMHAHVEPTRMRGTTYGGYAKLATLIKKYRASDPNVVLLNGGDTFQGTLYFNVYEGLADLAFMNAVGFQAMAIGNHEFDRGPGPLGAFAKGATFPLLAANLDVTAEPALKGQVHSSTVLTAGRQKIGVVGAVTPTLPTISSPGPNVKMLDLVATCQKAIDGLKAQGIDKIVLLTHVGYEAEKDLVGKLHGVDVLVGGHSHTLLCNLGIANFPQPAGPYPTVGKNADGETALVVQAHEWGKVLGRIKVQFDRKGRVVKWLDNEPVVVNADVPDDAVIQSLIAALKRPIADLSNKEVGQAKAAIRRAANEAGESPMGNLIADAMLEATRAQGAVMACMNAGGVRGDLEAGAIGYGAAISVQPFNNTLVLLDLTGAELLAALDHGVGGGGSLHISKGASYAADRSKPAGLRISNVVLEGERLDPEKTYRVCFNSFTASGGDAHETLKNSKGRRVDTGMLDIDALIEYLKKHSPVDPKVEGRIRGPAVRRLWSVATDLWCAATCRRVCLMPQVTGAPGTCIPLPPSPYSSLRSEQGEGDVLWSAAAKPPLTDPGLVTAPNR